MALSQNASIENINKGYHVPRLSASADTFFKGGLVNKVTASGKIKVASDTAGEVFSGHVSEYIIAGAADITIKIEMDDVSWFASATVVQTDVGKLVYATADDTLALTATNVEPAGRIVDIDITNKKWLVDFSQKTLVA